MRWTVVMDGRGRVTIPKEVRDKLGLKPGWRIDFVYDGEGRYFLKGSPPDASGPGQSRLGGCHGR